MGVVLALGAAICWGIADFLGGVNTRRVHVLGVALGTQVTGTIAIVVVLGVRGVGPPAGDLVIVGVLTGLIGVFALIGLYWSLANGVMARVAPVFATAAAIPVLVGLASGEDPSTVQLVGIPIAIAGLMLVSVEPWGTTVGTAGGSATRRALAVAIGTSVCLGLVLVGVDRVSEHDPVWAVFLLRITAATVICATALTVLGRRLGADARPPRAVVPIGLLDTSANVLFGTASTAGLLSLVAVIGSSFPAVTVMLSIALLHERLQPMHIAGVTGTFAGCAMIVGG